MAKEPPPKSSRTRPTPRKKSTTPSKTKQESTKPSQQRGAASPSDRRANGKPQRRTAAQAAVEHLVESRGVGAAINEFFRQSPSWLTSMVVHVVVLLILGLLMLPDIEELNREIATALNPEEQQVEEIEDDPLDDLEELNVDPNELTKAFESPNTEAVADVPSPIPEPEAAPPDINPLGDLNPENFFKKPGEGFAGGEGTHGRGGASKARLLREGGGTKQSEEAVARALKWLKEHQMPDGGWSFDHRPGRCGGRCGEPGSMREARFGATGLALMCFLGAGQTHKEGEYKKTVFYGLRWLTQNMNKQTGQMYRTGGRMYAHGIASIALCEACGMTDDRALLPYCRGGIGFILNAQDPIGGGWRYTPRQAGDTSVVGWQLMALKSAKWAYIKIPPNHIKGVEQFLDSVQTDSGAKYGYKDPGAGRATTAVGLLCRMYLGWKKDHPSLERGVQYLAKIGPSANNVYFNYYAAQVLRQYEGKLWKQFNEKLREHLIRTQVTKGHEYGSWYFKGGHNDAGGRLFTTCMSCMTLEVYYRHLPLYRTKASEDGFDE